MQPFPIALAIAFAAALLIAEHVVMYEQPWRLERPWSYVVGVLTLAAGWIVWGLTASGPIAPFEAVVSIILISFGSGAPVVLAYAIRGRLERVQRNTRIVARAEQLTQDIIDEGRDHARRQPNLHDPSRRN